VGEAWNHTMVRRVECTRCGDEFFSADRDAELCPPCAEIEKSDRLYLLMLDVAPVLT
jgi:hypothetical protein